MLSRVLTNNLRAAGTSIATPVGLFLLWLFSEWFFSTQAGAMLGLIGGSLALLGLVVAVSGFYYIVRG